MSQHWISTVAGRFGIVNDRWLVFGKLGGGWVQSNAVAERSRPGLERVQHRWWLADWRRCRIWLQVALDGQTRVRLSHAVELDFDHGSSVALSRDVQMIKAGINYKFESGVDPASGCRSILATLRKTKTLQKQSQNPIADLVSVPFQSNANFNAGPFNRTQEILNIQPVVPMHLSDDWNLISRTIMPLISQPSPLFDSNTNGIGDITEDLFLPPRTQAL